MIVGSTKPIIVFEQKILDRYIDKNVSCTTEVLEKCFARWTQLSSSVKHNSRMVLKVRGGSRPLWVIDVEYYSEPYPDEPIYETLHIFGNEKETIPVIRDMTDILSY